MDYNEFFKACSGSEIKLCRFSFGEVLASPNAQTFLFRRLSIQLSLGGLLSSRARFCFTGQQQLKALETPSQFSGLGRTVRRLLKTNLPELPVDKPHTRLLAV